MKIPELQPVPTRRPSEAFEDHDFALYVDGRRVLATAKSVELHEDGISVLCTFTTSRSALFDANANPAEEIAWGGWKPGDSCHVRQPMDGRKFPSNGYVIVEKIEPSTRAGEPTYFVCTALTTVHSWPDGDVVCNASERVKIPATWFNR